MKPRTAPAAPFFSDLARLLRDGRPAETRVAYGADGPVTWRDFAALIDAAAEQAPGGRHLLAEADPLRFAAALLAARRKGSTPVIPPNFQPGTQTEFAARLEAERDTNRSDRTDAPPFAGIELYTSGSSGEPKRIAKRWEQLENECAALERLWGEALGPATVLATVPHHHIYGLLFRLLWPLLAGRPWVCAVCAEPTTLAQQLAAHPDALLVASPAHLDRLPALTDLAALPAPRRVFSSGGPLAAASAQALRAAWGAAPLEIFGSTETGGIAWRQRQHAVDDNDAAWTPLPGVSIDTAAKQGLGALSVRSPFLPDTQPWLTDDAVECLPDGRFHLRGRLDRTLKLEEKRLSLPAMEAHLSRHPWIAAAALTPLQRGPRTRLGAVVTLTAAGQSALNADRRSLVDALRRHLAAWYDAVLLPRHWRFVPTLPYDERGKLPQPALAGLFERSDRS